MDNDDEMHIEDEWKKQECKNWVRGAKGLEYLQKGLQNDVAKLVLRHRDQIVQHITSSIPGPVSQCKQCSGNNLLPEHAVQNDCRYNCIQRKSDNCFGSRKRNRRVCPNRFCSKLYDEIVNSHRHKHPLWTNTDPSTWFADPAGWSFAKCFQTTPSPGTSSSETDAAGLLSIILNDTFFQNEVACNLAAPNNYFSVAREIRNTLLHSSKMELDDIKLQDYLDTFIAVLQDRMFTDIMSREAVQSLVQLKNNNITISLSEEVELVKVRLEALRALDKLQETIEEGVSKIETQVHQAQIYIKEAESSTLDKMAKSDIHQRLKQTEETIRDLTNTIRQIQNDKPRVIQPESEENSTCPDPNVKTKQGFFRSLLDTFAYRRKKKELRKGLIEFYKSQHAKFHLSPIIDKQDDAPLLEFYVMPDINVITLERAFGGGGDKREPIFDLRSVFYKEGGLCREIYFTADAGYGKTFLSKRLVLTWCHAKDPDKKNTKYLRQEEIKTMAEFDFVFLVSLRDSFEDCHIIDMVMNQIIPDLETKNISQQDVEHILSNEKCLVILDGLDEWSHPENCKRADTAIPHRKAKNYTVLTTSRPWKLSDIKASQIDQKLEIAGLSEASAKSLKERVIQHLCAGKEEKIRVEEFNSSVKENKITNLVKIPIMLMYFLCLFCENRELGRSLCMLYSNITDMLFCRTIKIHKKVPQVDLSKISQSEFPQCFKETEFCIKFYTILAALGKLAFHTLLVETREENMLVFGGSVVDKFLNKECLSFCLDTGIITESNVRSKLIKPETKVSFAHKTVHEFFAALYSITDPGSFQKIVLSKCKCVKDILEMSNVLKFVSGINEKMSFLILSEVINIVNNDPITHAYRSNLVYSINRQQVKAFQDLCVSCCREFTNKFQCNLCLQDVFIDKSCQVNQYCENLKQLTTRNTQDIRSLNITMKETPYSTTQNVIDYFVLRDLANIEKIVYRGKYSDNDILPLLNSSVKCLCLTCQDSWSHLLFGKVKSLQKLEIIGIQFFKMSHNELNFLLDYISQRDCMKEIGLWDLSCTDHKDSCTALRVDLTHLSPRKLFLINLPVTQVVVNVSSLEICCLADLHNTDLVLEFLNCADCKLEKFECSNLNSSAAIDTLLDILPLLHHIKQVWLGDINLGTRNVTFLPQVNIESLVLNNVTMEASTLRGLVNFVHKLQQPVTVYILDCTISPEEEFKTVKEKIKISQRHCRILKDEEGWFVYETIKNGD